MKSSFKFRDCSSSEYTKCKETRIGRQWRIKKSEYTPYEKHLVNHTVNEEIMLICVLLLKDCVNNDIV
jgi:hypothetical protein